MSPIKRSFGALALLLMAVAGVGMFSATPASADAFQTPYGINHCVQGGTISWGTIPC
jgi:hypothetical protein